MTDKYEKILDQLTCPICFAYPEKEVFQCQNGHPICSSCTPPLQNCPTCQLPLGLPQIRCRLMESLLEIVDLPCANKDSGCTQRFLRNDLPEHHKICGFRPVSLCNWMGYECDFAASTVAPLIEHLDSCHNAKRVGSSLVWNNYSPVHKSRRLFLKECAANSDPQSLEKTWFLFLVTRSAEPNKENLFSCVPIHLHDGQCIAEHEVHLELFNEERNRLLFKWTGYASNYKDAENDFLYPSFRLMSNNIKKQALKFSQLIEFNLSLRVSVEVKPIP